MSSKSPVSAEVTPSKKTLKQARLPFMLLSDTAKSPEISNRKRKLSNTEPETNAKIGRISKENESIVLSDDDIKDDKLDEGNNNQASILNESLNSSGLSVTPKQLAKKQELDKRREDREKEKLERERKRQQEKEDRAKQKQDKEDAKKREREEAKKRERDEKEEAKRIEKEEKEKQKELIKKIKEEKEELKRKEREEKEEQKKKEREEKEEQRKKEKEAKEEERRKKLEVQEQEKVEQELKKKKAAEAFVNFFVPKQIDRDQKVVGGLLPSENPLLSSFTVKSDMRLAPVVRFYLDDDRKQVLETYVNKKGSDKQLYLSLLKKESYRPGTDGKTWVVNDKEDDCVIVEDEMPPTDCSEIISCDTTNREKLRPKLISFHDNRRPPYWGTWRKGSQAVTPRRPFGQDKQIIDYEVDSDDDWEDEAEGESISGSAAGSDDEPDDDYEVDNEVFVPHGYLSDQEATMDEDDVLSMSPETQKARLKDLENEFESEMKKPTEKLKPRLYGLLYESTDGKPTNCVDALWSYFGKFSMIMNDPTPLLKPSEEQNSVVKKKKTKQKKEKKVVENTENKIEENVKDNDNKCKYFLNFKSSV